MEIWKSLAFMGFPKYEISSYGNIRSLDYQKTGECKPLKPQLLRDGYLQVTLGTNNGSGKFMLHRLVALAFVPREDGKPQAHHKDHNPLNCRADNLEWVTHQENMLFSAPRVRAHRNPNSKLDWAAVKLIRDVYVRNSRTLGIRPLAERFNVSYNCIRDIVIGKSWVEEGD